MWNPDCKFTSESMELAYSIMSKITVISPESAAVDHREKIEQEAENRVAAVAAAFKADRVEFEVERTEQTVDESLRDYRGRAVDELQRQLSEAGAKEAAGRKALFENADG